VQEMTITFVPKVVAIVAVMFLAGTASLEALQAFGLRTTELVKEYRNVAGRPG